MVLLSDAVQADDEFIEQPALDSANIITRRGVFKLAASSGMEWSADDFCPLASLFRKSSTLEPSIIGPPRCKKTMVVHVQNQVLPMTARPRSKRYPPLLESACI